MVVGGSGISSNNSRGPHFSAANFAKFRGAVCEIPRAYYPQIPYMPLPVGVVILADHTLKYKEFIVTCNTKPRYITYIRPLIMKIHVIILIIVIKVSLQ